MTAAVGLREIQAGELAVIFYCSAVVGLRGVDFAAEATQKYSLSLERYQNLPFASLFFQEIPLYFELLELENFFLLRMF